MQTMRYGLALAAGLLICAQVAAEGTFELRQGMGTTSPIYLEGSLTSTNYDQHRVTFMRVDIEDPANEVIDLYGQALSGSPDLQVWCPGGIPLVTPDAPYTPPAPDYTADFTATEGELTSFADVADVQAISTRPRPPRTYALTGSSATCGQAGVYTLRYASAGIDTSGQQFFDIRVRDTSSASLESGRVWSDKYAFSMGNATGTVGAELYVVAGEDRGDDYLGIVWDLDLNDIAPFGFQLYANERGVGPAQYHYQSIGSSASPQPTMDPQYPIYLNPPAKTVVTPGALGTIDSINAVCTPGGGNDVIIRFDTEGALPYTLRVDENNDMNFDLSEVIATGTSVDGTNTVVWDGVLPGGGSIMAGSSYPIQLTLTTGEVHFPFYDVEDADPGPVIMPFSVPSSPTTDLYYWDDTDPSVTSTAGGGTTSGPNGVNMTHDWANGLNDYNDQNMIDTWKYADVQYVEDVYAFPASCASDPRVGLAKDAQIIADNGDGTVQLELAFRVENMGNVDLQDFSLTDDIDAALPAPVTWSIDSLTASGGLVPNAGFDGVGDIELLDGTSALALGDVGFVTLVLTVDFNGQTGPYTNVATVTAEDSGGNPTSDDSHDGTDPDPNGDGIPDEGDPTPIPVAESDLEVAKVIDNAMPYVEDTVTWTITVTNNGPVTETGAQVTDVLPASFAVDSVTPSAGSWSAPVWTLPTLLPGQSETLTLTGRFTADGMFNNTAEVTAAVNPDPDSTPGNGMPGEDDQDSAAATAVPLADLALAKTDGGVSVIPGATVTYTLSVTNNGPSDAASVLLDDPTPTGLAFVSADAPCAGGFPCNLGTVADGATVNINVTFQVPPAYAAPDPIINNATVSTTTDDPDPGNDAASDATPLAPPEADLAVSKSVDDAMPLVGDDVTFTVTIVNNGPSQATGVVVNDLLPGGYAFVSATPSTGSYNSGTGVWTVGTMNPSVPETLTITATVQASGATLNTATVSGDEDDPEPGNDSDSADTDPVPSADVSVTKTDGGATVIPGEDVTYTLVVTNNGLSQADNVMLDDPTPAGLAFASADAPCGGGFPCALGNLADGDSASVDVTFSVPSGYTAPDPISNTATVSADTNDPDGGNDSATDTTPLGDAEADMEITKTVTPEQPEVGDTVTFTLVVTNNGPSDATGVMVDDPLPAGYTFVSATPSQGTWTAPDWTVGTVVNGDSATLDITATVTDVDDYLNTATVIADPVDPVPDNDTDDASIRRVVLALEAVCIDDVSYVNYTVTPLGFTPGANPSDIEWITEDGNNTIVETLTGQPLSGQLLWLGMMLDGGGNPTDWPGWEFVGGEWVPDNDGLRPDMRIHVMVNPEDEQVVTYPPVEVGCSANPPVADLVIDKDDGGVTVATGGSVTYTLTVTNNGPSEADNVIVDDVTPSGLTFGANTGACTTPFPCNVGTLDVGESAVIQTTFVVPLDYAGDDPIANIATVTSDTQELEEADNTASDTTPVDFDGQDPVIGIAKVLSGFQGNDPFTLAFTFTVENLGNVGLSDVQVVDDLATTFPAPSVYSVDSLTATPPLAVNPGYDGSLDTDLLDAAASSLAVGESATIEMVITLNPNAAAGPYQNQAFASGLGPVGQVTEDASNDGLDPDPDSDGDPTGPDENTPTPIDVRGFQHFPVPVMSPIGLFILLVLMGGLGAAGARRYHAAGS